MQFAGEHRNAVTDCPALPRSFTPADLGRERQVKRTLDAIAPDEEQSKDALAALPLALLYFGRRNDPLAVKIGKLEPADRTGFLDSVLYGPAVLVAETPFWKISEMLTIKVIEAVADMLMLAPRVETALAFGRGAVVRLRTIVKMHRAVRR